MKESSLLLSKDTLN